MYTVSKIMETYNSGQTVNGKIPAKTDPDPARLIASHNPDKKGAATITIITEVAVVEEQVAAEAGVVAGDRE